MSRNTNDKVAYRAFLKNMLDDSLVQAKFSLMEAMINQFEEAEQGENSSRRERRVVHRGRDVGHALLIKDYFATEPTYHESFFCRRFRMSRRLFSRIVDSVENYSDYFKSKTDASGRQGFSPIQKCTAAIRQLAYGAPADQCDEYLRMSEQTANRSLMEFCRAVCQVFASQYLRSPNAADIQRLLALHEEKHGFPGMLESLDCMHWEGKNCPVAWQGSYTRGDHGVPTIILEAVASQDLWIWHAFFGLAGSRNDISVLHESPLFNDVLHGVAPDVNFTVNGTQYNKGCYLTDGIYLEWATFVKSFQCPDDPKRKKFKQRQEAARKDVERAFGVLQSRWPIIRGPTRFWYKEDLNEIILSCIILHNMIIEDEGDDGTKWSNDDTEPPVQARQGHPGNFRRYLQIRAEMQDREVHHQLRHDLVDHIWNEPN